MVVKGKERKSEKKDRAERSFEVAAGSFTFRNEIGGPLHSPIYSSLFLFIPRYRMLRDSLQRQTLCTLFLECRGPPFEHLSQVRT